jgi:hypothetical protein
MVELSVAVEDADSVQSAGERDRDDADGQPGWVGTLVLARKTPLKRTAKKRKSPNATARADVLFSRLIRDRDHACVRCGEVNNLQCAHIWSRRYRALRWRFENAITLCQGCHLYFTLRPAEWAEWCGQWWFSEDQLWSRVGFHLHMDVAWSYDELRQRALNDPPEKAADALERLQAIS